MNHKLILALSLGILNPGPTITPRVVVELNSNRPITRADLVAGKAKVTRIYTGDDRKTHVRIEA